MGGKAVSGRLVKSQCKPQWQFVRSDPHGLLRTAGHCGRNQERQMSTAISERERRARINELKAELRSLLKKGEAVYIERGTPVQGSKLK